MPDRDQVTEQTEKDRQASQARAEQNRAAAEADSAQDRADAQKENADLDPNSPEGRQAAIRRGDPVQLRGEEEAHGMVRGTATTSNESGSGFPASDEHRFVTGAAGVPIPESAGIPPQRPGDTDPAAHEDHDPDAVRDMSPQDVAVPPQEAGEDREQVGTGDEAQVAEPEELEPQDQQVEDERAAQQEAAEKEQASAGKGSKKGRDADKGDHGPGTTQ